MKNDKHHFFIPLQSIDPLTLLSTMLAPELSIFVGVTINQSGKVLPGWKDHHIGGTIFTWKRIRDGKTLQEIVNSADAELSEEQIFNLIKSGQI